VTVDGTVLWRGIIRKGAGQTAVDYSTIVDLYQEETVSKPHQPPPASLTDARRGGGGPEDTTTEAGNDDTNGSSHDDGPAWLQDVHRKKGGSGRAGSGKARPLSSLQAPSAALGSVDVSSSRAAVSVEQHPHQQRTSSSSSRRQSRRSEFRNNNNNNDDDNSSSSSTTAASRTTSSDDTGAKMQGEVHASPTTAPREPSPPPPRVGPRPAAQADLKQSWDSLENFKSTNFSRLGTERRRRRRRLIDPDAKAGGVSAAPLIGTRNGDVDGGGGGGGSASASSSASTRAESKQSPPGHIDAKDSKAATRASVHKAIASAEKTAKKAAAQSERHKAARDAIRESLAEEDHSPDAKAEGRRASSSSPSQEKISLDVLVIAY
jgi:hypothetical protein